MTDIDLSTVTHALVTIGGKTMRIELSETDRKKLAAVHASADATAHSKLDAVNAAEAAYKAAMEAAGIVEPAPTVTAKAVKSKPGKKTSATPAVVPTEADVRALAEALKGKQPTDVTPDQRAIMKQAGYSSTGRYLKPEVLAAFVNAPTAHLQG